MVKEGPFVHFNEGKEDKKGLIYSPNPLLSLVEGTRGWINFELTFVGI